MKREGVFYEVRRPTDNGGLLVLEQHDLAKIFEQIDSVRAMQADQGYENENEKLLIVRHQWEKNYDDESGIFLSEKVERKTVGIYEQGKYQEL